MHWGQNFDPNRKALSLWPFVAGFKKSHFEVWFYTYLLMFSCMYIAPGQEQTIPWWQSLDINRKPRSLWRSWRGILVSGCLSVRPSVQEPCMLGFWNFRYWFLMEKYLTHVFFSCPSYLPFWSYAPLKKSERNLMHAISYELCMLGFWNFIYRFLMEKIADPYYFLVRVISPSRVMPLWKKLNEILSARYLEKVF